VSLLNSRPLSSFFFKKEGCTLSPSCWEWNNNKIGETEKLHFAFKDKQAAFNDLVSKEPKPPKKPTNEYNPIICDTPNLEKKTRI
jgi:hypothetical protein